VVAKGKSPSHCRGPNPGRPARRIFLERLRKVSRIFMLPGDLTWLNQADALWLCRAVICLRNLTASSDHNVNGTSAELCGNNYPSSIYYFYWRYCTFGLVLGQRYGRYQTFHISPLCGCVSRQTKQYTSDVTGTMNWTIPGYATMD